MNCTLCIWFPCFALLYILFITFLVLLPVCGYMLIHYSVGIKCAFAETNTLHKNFKWYCWNVTTCGWGASSAALAIVIRSWRHPSAHYWPFVRGIHRWFPSQRANNVEDNVLTLPAFPFWRICGHCILKTKNSFSSFQRAFNTISLIEISKSWIEITHHHFHWFISIIPGIDKKTVFPL